MWFKIVAFFLSHTVAWPMFTTSNSHILKRDECSCAVVFITCCCRFVLNTFKQVTADRWPVTSILSLFRRWPISAFQQLTCPHKTCKYQNVQHSNTAQNNARGGWGGGSVPHPFQAELCGRLRFIFFKLTCKWYAFTSSTFKYERISWLDHSNT